MNLLSSYVCRCLEKRPTVTPPRDIRRFAPLMTRRSPVEVTGRPHRSVG
jgi:hypothetical protein